MKGTGFLKVLSETMHVLVMFFSVLAVFLMVSIRIPAEGLQMCLQRLKIENRIGVLHF